MKKIPPIVIYYGVLTAFVATSAIANHIQAKREEKAAREAMHASFETIRSELLRQKTNLKFYEIIKNGF